MPGWETLDSLVFSQDHEEVSQGGAGGLCSSREEVINGHHEVLSSKFCLWVVLLLGMKRTVGGGEPSVTTKANHGITTAITIPPLIFIFRRNRVLKRATWGSGLWCFHALSRESGIHLGRLAWIMGYGKTFGHDL